MIVTPQAPLLYSKAVPRLMPYWIDLPDLDRSRPTVIGHTNGGGTDHGSLFGWFSRAGNDISSHFQIMLDGTVEQYIPLNKQAYAQFAGNAFAWSVEHEDGGNNLTPLTDAQLASFADLVSELGVPWTVAPVTGGGVGWHQQYPEWNTSGHDCMGPVRNAQIQALIAQGGFNVVLSPADKQWIADLVSHSLKTVQDTIILHVRPAVIAEIDAKAAEIEGHIK